MDHVKTFFKTLLWTLLWVIIVLWGFFSYIKFMNKNLWQKVSNIIYAQEKLECPIQKCDCEGNTWTSQNISILETKIDNLKQKADDIEVKIDSLWKSLSTLNFSSSSDSVNKKLSTWEKIKMENTIKDLKDKIQELETKLN